MKKVGLFFGSFNPIHNGHLHIAELASEYVDEVWFVVSPHNPLKDSNALIDQNHRLNMVELAIQNNDLFKSCDIEFNMEKPSYTFKTLEELKKLPNKYYLIFGSDCINTIHTWENGNWILTEFPIIGFKRDSEDIIHDIEQIIVSDSDLSSTQIRNKIRNDEPVSNLVPQTVADYLKFHKLCK